MIASKTQIIATIGPSSSTKDMIRAMVGSAMDVARFNFSWGTLEEREREIALVREVAQEMGAHIPIIQDLPGPRVQHERGHGFDVHASALTDRDREYIRFGAKHNLEYIAVSFVRSAEDIADARKAVTEAGGSQRIIAKIERREAVDRIDEIIAVSDAVMIARGDLGDNVPFEEVPFIQADIIGRANRAGKPVITATEMLLSMVFSDRPTRAEVTDVVEAILLGSDAVMLSDETARGAHPAEVIAAMERILLAAERRIGPRVPKSL